MSEIATFASGCFWCTEAIFQNLKGVLSVKSGYSGGKKENPTYAEVSQGTTGHAECLQINFDPSVITYKDLLSVFFSTHDPTTVDRQGADMGTQYRSVIFYHNERQKNEAEEVINRLEKDKVYLRPIVTELVKYENFFPAEGYHQNFYNNNPLHPYCQIVINPKLAKLREKYQKFMK